MEIDQQLGDDASEADGPWAPAGAQWRGSGNTSRVLGISGAELQCDDPEAVANKWAEIVETPCAYADGVLSIALDNASLRFVACTDGRPEGLGGIDIRCSDKAAVLASADELGIEQAGGQLNFAGMRWNLLDE